MHENPRNLCTRPASFRDLEQKKTDTALRMRGELATRNWNLSCPFAFLHLKKTSLQHSSKRVPPLGNQLLPPPQQHHPSSGFRISGPEDAKPKTQTTPKRVPPPGCPVLLGSPKMGLILPGLQGRLSGFTKHVFCGKRSSHIPAEITFSQPQLPRNKRRSPFVTASGCHGTTKRLKGRERDK